MKKEHLLKSLLVVLAMSLFSMVAFAQATTVGTYKKVTEAPANGDWSGQYLIVNETESGAPFIYDGSTASSSSKDGVVPTSVKTLCVFSKADGTLEVTQAAMDKSIAVAEGMGGAQWYANGNFHVNIDSEGHIIIAKGGYIGSNGSNNKVAYDKTETSTNPEFKHVITLNSDGSVDLASTASGKTTKYLRWYSSMKITYYGKTTGKSICLYKLVTDEGGEGEGGDVVVAPEKPTASVESGDYLEAFSVTLACATDGATIKYKLNGGEEQTYSEAINISATTTLVAWAEKDTLKSEEVTFTYNLPAEVANIAAFIADESGSNVRIASTMTVILRSSTSVWVKDESGYMLVKGKVGSTSPSYSAGDQFTGLVGKANVVGGVKELTPANFPTATATGVAVEPEVVAAADVTVAIPHKYIKLEGAKLESKQYIMLTASLSGITFNITDIASKYMNDKTIVVGDYINLSALVSADSKGVLYLTLVSMEKIEKPEVKATWSIEEGATIESLGNISVTFDGVEKAATTQTVPVCFYAVDENNVETPVTGLATAGAISASSTNATITFDASSYGNLAEGKYCIRLAVGDVYFNGDKANVSTEEYVLTFNYVLPVEPTFTVSPENHSIVREFKEIVITYPELETIGVKSFVGKPDITWPFFNQTLVNENGEVIAEQAMAPMVCEQVAANAVKISLSTNYGFASVATAGTYSVTIPAGLIIFPTNQSNRAFTLYYTVDSNPTDVDNATLSTIFVQDGRIVAEGEYQIYTITGQNVTGMNGSLENGVYVVKSANAAVKVVVK